MNKTDIPRLKKKYNEEIIPSMMGDFGFENKMEVPKIEKITINVGVGKMAGKDPKIIDKIVEDISLITGQRPQVTKAKKSIAGFKLRDGMPVGVAVTMRKEKMYEFLDRLINVSLPRIRDFRGLSPKSFDKEGNYSIGINEHTVFPEVTVESVEAVFGLQINIKIKNGTKEHSYALLSKFGFPFKKEGNN